MPAIARANHELANMLVLTGDFPAAYDAQTKVVLVYEETLGIDADATHEARINLDAISKRLAEMFNNGETRVLSEGDTGIDIL